MNQGPSAPESSMLTTRLPSRPLEYMCVQNSLSINRPSFAAANQVNMTVVHDWRLVVRLEPHISRDPGGSVVVSGVRQ